MEPCASAGRHQTHDHEREIFSRAELQRDFSQEVAERTPLPEMSRDSARKERTDCRMASAASPFKCSRHLDSHRWR